MIVDTSALIAIMRHEPERQLFLAAFEQGNAKMSAVTYFEFGIVADAARDVEVSAAVDEWVGVLNLVIVPVDQTAAAQARSAYAQFGKGRHPAQLNFGDCFAYALAKETGEPLLFKGNDFSQTDIISAV